MASMTFFIGSVTMALSGTYVLNKFGIKPAILFGSALCLAGTWLKSLINQGFSLLIVG